MKVLIVDDDKRIRKLIASVVSDLSEEILECNDGVSAQESYRANMPDWVLMDLRMPGIDGIAATRMIRSSYPDARIVIVTSFDSAALREDARSAGACGYVLKENIHDLREIIESATHH